MHNKNIQNELRSIMWDIKHDPQAAIGNAIMAIGYALHYLGDGDLVSSHIMTVGAGFNDDVYTTHDDYENARIFSDMVEGGSVTEYELQYYLFILDRMFNTIPADRRY